MDILDLTRNIACLALSFQICSLLALLRKFDLPNWLWVEGYVWVILWTTGCYFIRHLFVQRHFWQETPKIRGYLWLLGFLTLFLSLRYYFYEIWQEPSNWGGISEFAFFGVFTVLLILACVMLHEVFRAKKREWILFVVLGALLIISHSVLRFFNGRYIFWETSS